MCRCCVLVLDAVVLSCLYSGYGNIPGGAGGGLIRLAVSGTLTINGVISANGVNGGVNDYYDQSQGGGGSGGSIWLTADTLAGTGE